MLRLPYLYIRGVADNPIERLFWGKVPIERASSMLIYHPGNTVEHIIHAIKYGGQDTLAVDFGRRMAQELLGTGFFDGIDYLQPIPLHPNRQRSRGYNQSECLAQGIAQLTGLPIGRFVKRIKDNVSQTQLSSGERKANVQAIFAPNTDELRAKRPRHLLFVDDVITTGSTAISCISALTGQPGDTPGNLFATDLRVSILSLGYAGTLRAGRVSGKRMQTAPEVVQDNEFKDRQYRSLS